MTASNPNWLKKASNGVNTDSGEKSDGEDTNSGEKSDEEDTTSEEESDGENTDSKEDSSNKADSESNDRGPNEINEIQSKHSPDEQDKSKEIVSDEEDEVVCTGINVHSGGMLGKEIAQPEEQDEIIYTGTRKRNVIVGGVGGETRETAIDLTRSSKSIYEDSLESCAAERLNFKNLVQPSTTLSTSLHASEKSSTAWHVLCSLSTVSAEPLSDNSKNLISIMRFVKKW
ncbi:hypothetical protein BT96DRAFT_1070887 [Gymnopus androsaceus JB14]|uniref:Uncharacterized protein n=1 Tax=Gymnopus androsaceus JB14 TaxID=1447944 RepID=A0A6A4GTS8_9AGAR|nr:hypothetical protein BT96DRAFT_1070887 [Gymnopus androsaceus JB14]